MITANDQLAANVRDLPNTTGVDVEGISAKAKAVMDFLGTCDPKSLAECVQAVGIKWPAEGTMCRISISMLGFHLRHQVILMMEGATKVNRIIGAPPHPPQWKRIWGITANGLPD